MVAMSRINEKFMGISSNLVRQPTRVDRASREKLNGHRSMVLWFTGLSGAGKSTLGTAVEHALASRGCHAVMLDGDNLRHGLCGDLGFSLEDRSENIRRVGEMAKLFMDAGMIVITSFISPLVSDRERARALFNEGDFFEIFCDSSLQSCEARDVKGLYQRARRGEIPEFTGISSPYEPPVNPSLTLRTDQDSVDECVSILLEFIEQNGGIRLRAL